MTDEEYAMVNLRPAADIVAACHREIAQRYERHVRRHFGPQSKKDRVKALRRAQVLRVLRHRYGPNLPNDAQGREALQLLLELDLDGSRALAIAPWAMGDELERQIVAAETNWGWWCGKIGHKIGVRLEVTFREKTELALHHLGCIDADPRGIRDYYRERKRERDRARRAHKRQKATAQAEMTGQGAPVDYWDLMYSDPRACALAGGVLYDFQWWRISDLIAEAGVRLGAFKGLRLRCTAPKRTSRGDPA